MNRILTLTAAWLFATTLNATCLPGTEEIGDIGPDDTRVCHYLESHYPDADIRIVDRLIHAADRMSVLVEVDTRPQRMEYRLHGYHWDLVNESRLANQ